LYTRDHEGIGPLDIATKDRKLISNVSQPGIVLVIHELSVYVCFIIKQYLGCDIRLNLILKHTLK